jgi:hypothetical protein
MLCIALHISTCGIAGAADLVVCQYPNGDTDIEPAHRSPHQDESQQTTTQHHSSSAHEAGEATSADRGQCQDQPLVVHQDYPPADPPTVALPASEVVKAHPLFELDEPQPAQPSRARFRANFADLPPPHGRLQGVMLLI